MNVADAIAERSLCSRAKVGCVLVASDQSVLAVSYNGPPAGFEVVGGCNTGWCPRGVGIGAADGNYDNCPTVHAEVNACARASQVRDRGVTAYSTKASCLNCCKTMAASGIVRLVHRVTESDMHRNPDASEEFLRQCGIEVVRWSN